MLILVFASDWLFRTETSIGLCDSSLSLLIDINIIIDLFVLLFKKNIFLKAVGVRQLSRYPMGGSWHSITLAFQSTSTGKPELWPGPDLTSLEQEALE